MPAVKVGSPAPAFTLEDGDKRKVSLSEFRGQPVLLAFFPFAFSPVCTKEMTCFQDDLSELQEAGVQVLGISVDSGWTQKAFAASLGVTFPLLSDFNKEVCTAYGTLRPEGFSNRVYVLVDGQGIVRYVHTMPTPGERLENADLLREVRKLA